MAGLFVSFEGIDRAGKTTQARLLCESLGERAFAVREPGGTAIGERVRTLLKDPALEIGPKTEALLFAAARAELVARVVRPALAAGRVVVSDRFVDSSLAYQGEGRGLGVDEVAAINRFATAERSGEGDRLEDEGLNLQLRVEDAYRRLATDSRWRRIAADRPPEEVHRDVLAAVEAALATVPA